jgi:hypothetical protein
MNQVEKQLKEWGACKEGFDWAVGSCKTMAEVWDTCQRGNWLKWILTKEGSWTQQDEVRIAVAYAEHALPIFEKAYPEDDRPRKAIEAARAWAENPTEENRKAAADAANATNTALFAANATKTAWFSADALPSAYISLAAWFDAAANTDWFVAPATNTAWFVAVADAANAASERKWQADEIRKLIKNPFKEG